ncbi:TPA: hypothetical protein DEB00_00880 [Candidatus Uhrbacteria bacterium]|nr:hypothetical protein [Candidatus Uhrbacteria bacterium]
MATTESTQPSVDQAQAAARLQAQRSVALKAKFSIDDTKSKDSKGPEPTDPMEQLRISLDRLFAGEIFSWVGAPLALGLLFIRGIASLKGLQSLPTRHIQFTETNPFKMLPDAQKMRPFTFTKRLGTTAAFAILFLMVIAVMIQLAPFILLMGYTAGILSLLNPFA